MFKLELIQLNLQTPGSVCVVQSHTLVIDLQRSSPMVNIAEEQKTHHLQSENSRLSEIFVDVGFITNKLSKSLQIRKQKNWQNFRISCNTQTPSNLPLSGFLSLFYTSYYHYYLNGD